MRRNIGLGALTIALFLLTASESFARHHRRGCGGCNTGCQTANVAPCGGCNTGCETGGSMQQQNPPTVPAVSGAPSDINAPQQNAPPAPAAPRPSAAAPKAPNVTPLATTSAPTTYDYANRGFGRRIYSRR